MGTKETTDFKVMLLGKLEENYPKLLEKAQEYIDGQQRHPEELLKDYLIADIPGFIQEMGLTIEDDSYAGPPGCFRAALHYSYHGGMRTMWINLDTKPEVRQAIAKQDMIYTQTFVSCGRRTC